METLKKIFLWAFWGCLISTWATTLVAFWREGKMRLLVLAAFTAPCWALLYFAEGLELAVAARIETGNSPVADPHTFFTRRQAMVILPITYISVATVYPWLQVPFIGRLYGTAPFWFSLALVSLTTLWFAQVVPKRLAVANPEKFLAARHTSLFLKLVDVVGWFVDGPSDDVFRRLHRDHAIPERLADCRCAVCDPTGYAALSAAYRCSCAICNH